MGRVTYFVFYLIGKPQNQQEQDKKNVYENWMLENKAWIMAKIENLRQNLKQLNSKLETVTQKEKDVSVIVDIIASHNKIDN